MISAFNIRVYAIIVNDRQEILLTDEERFGSRMTKFPGGGLQFNEGTIDCLKREALEEFGQAIEIDSHFYTTDFFQQTLFHPDQQLISIYYKAHFADKVQFRIAQRPFDFQMDKGEIISFRFESLAKLEPEILTFPIDQHVLRLLKNPI